MPKVKDRTLSFVLSYVLTHILRSRSRSLLSMGLALLLAGSVGQFAVMRLLYEDAYVNIEIKAYIADGVDVNGAYEIGSSGYTASAYYENRIDVNCRFEFGLIAIDVTMTNDIERFAGDAAWAEEAELEMLDGYNSEVWGNVSRTNYAKYNICILESRLMDELGVGLGDTIQFITTHFYSLDDLTDPANVTFVVVGRAHGARLHTAYIPVSMGLESILEPEEFVFDHAEYTLLSPQHADEFRLFAEKRIIGSIGGVGYPLVMDTSEAENISRLLDLFNTLFPLAMVAVAALSAIAPGLIVMQAEKEASIMRVLGTTKKRTHALLVTEQAALCAAGLVCAALLLLGVNSALPQGIAIRFASLALTQLAACIAGALVCAVIITRRRVLELLQMKE